jgi:hypothetical protein
MADFYLLIRHAVTDGDRDALQERGCTIVADFQFRPVPPAAAAELDGGDGYVARVPAADASEAVARVADGGIDDARIWRDYPLAALP